MAEAAAAADTLRPDDGQAPAHPIMQLRVHGGGFIDHMQTHGLGEDLKGFDTHMLDAAPKARLSEEEMLFREVNRRRQVEKERRARIFDAKRRTIGVDKEVLDTQVAEKLRRQAEEKAANAAIDQNTMQVEKHLKLMEIDKQKAKRQMEKDCKDFSLTSLSYETRREFDLNDPLAKRKGLPARVGDDDPRCGPASGQQFHGEDLLVNERKKQQQLAMVGFLEQQKFEKEMLKKQEKDEDLAYYAQMEKLRNQIEEREAELKKQKQRLQHEENTKKMHEMVEQRMREAQDLAEANRKELEHHTTDPFLNEVTSNGTKGMSREQKRQVQGMQLEQLGDKMVRDHMQKFQDRELEQEAEQTRRSLVIMERDKSRARRNLQLQMAEENKKLHAEQQQNKKKLDMVYRAGFGPEFFEQFGKTTR